MDKDTINRILELTDIVELIGSYFPLKKTGTNYKALCPFHQEKTPSFVVSEKKQIYKCFGCGKAGNAISFVMEYEKLSFPEAIKKLAQRVGIVLKSDKTSPQKKSKKELIYKIYKLSNAFFQDNLKNYGGIAQNYLQERNIGKETIIKFELGYALDSFGGLKNYLLKNQINEKILPLTGLFSEGNKGWYDTFRNRLMFPIRSVNGKVVAFGGRVLADDQKGGKYINSPTTPIYTKGRELYGLDKTRFEIAKLDEAIICEGYTDLLRLYEFGFKNCVASLGTSLTDQQINLLSRYAGRAVVLYDGDLAGRKAAFRAGSNLLKADIKARIAEIPEGNDPDSFLVKQGRDALKKLITTAPDLINFLKNDAVMKLDMKAKLELLVEVLNDLNDKMGQELLIKQIADIFSISERALLERIKPVSIISSKNQMKQKYIRYGEERELLKHILTKPEMFKKVAQELDSSYFLFKIYSEIYEELIKHKMETERLATFLEEIKKEDVRTAIAELAMEEIEDENFSDLLKVVKLRKLKFDLKQINKGLLQDPENKELKNTKHELRRKIINLDNKVVTKTLY